MSKRPADGEEFAAWNEEMVQRYDPDLYHTRSPLPIRIVERMRVRSIKRFLGAQAHHRVLEVGCGGGNVLERMTGQKFGIDLSPFIIAKARKRLGPETGLVRGDAMNLPFADGSLDRLICSEVLEHVLEPEVVIKEMRRILAPGGWAVVSVPNEALINRVKQTIFRIPLGRRLLFGADYQPSEKMDDEWHLHEFDLLRLRTAVAGSFTVGKVAGIPSAVFPMRYVVKLIPIASGISAA